jgi:hypothetical protein
MGVSIGDHIRNGKNFVRELIKKADPKHTKLIGVWIRAFHFMLPCACMVFVAAGPRWLANLSIVFLVLVIGLYLYLKGCILTWLEKKLCREDVNIADFSLVVLGYETDNNNRNVITLFFFPFYFAFIMLIYYYRFDFKAIGLEA